MKIQTWGNSKFTDEFKKNMVRVDKLMVECYDSYQAKSFKVMSRRVVFTFLNEDDALEFKNYFIDEVSQDGLYDARINLDDFNLDEVQYHLVVRVINNQSN